jgi:hypothetical protein
LPPQKSAERLLERIERSDNIIHKSYLL